MTIQVKISRSKYDIVVEALCLVILCGLSLYLIINWGKLPERIPGHYNAAGEIDRWGSRWELIFCLAVTWICYLGISVVERFPQMWNTAVVLTAENIGRIYRILKNMIITLKLYVVCIFTSLVIWQLRAVPLPGWYLWAIWCPLAGMILFFIIKMKRNK